MLGACPDHRAADEVCGAGVMGQDAVVSEDGGVAFFRSRVGARIAYTSMGNGPPIIMLPPWISHLGAIRALSGYRRFHEVVSRHHTVVLYDKWGTGLSDRERTEFSLESEVATITDLADHLNLRRFALVGPSHGARVAVAAAHREARRVSHLVLYGGGARAVIDPATWTAFRELALTNWPVAARSMAAMATFGGERGDEDAFVELLLAAASPETAVAIRDAALGYEVAHLHASLHVPTLVLHRRDDPFASAEGFRELARRIPNARLETLDGTAHVHLMGDAEGVGESIVAFTRGESGGGSAQLSDRQAEVMRLVAAGASNAEVAAQLVLSVRTVERHLLTTYAKLGVRGRTEAVARWHQAASPSA